MNVSGTSEAIANLNRFLSETPIWRQRCWQGAKALNGQNYGSYKPISQEKLIGRTFHAGMERSENKPCIEWLDVYFDPKTNKYQPFTP